MSLERQSIEKKDFPVGRRGYDPEAVDAHLAALADEVADFKRSARRRNDTLASSASDQVRAIVEAAENSASEIQREAESDAREIRQEAGNEAQAAREHAAAQAQEYVGKVSTSTASMLERLDAMEGELGAMIESLRTGATRLDADLRLLESDLAEVSDALKPRQRFEAEAGGPDEPTAAAGMTSSSDTPATEDSDPESARIDQTDQEHGAPEPLPGAVGAESLDTSSGSASQAEGPDDAEGARLIALNMALNGTPRDETARYLSENFQIADRDSLLDEVYSSVEG